MEICGKNLVAGAASGKVLHSDTALSLWGGVDPLTGIVIDDHHPLRGRSIVGSILALPSGRGSCTGSMVMLELLLNSKGPAALILARQDEILTLGVLVAQSMFDTSIPVVVLSTADFLRLRDVDHACVHDYKVSSMLQSSDGKVQLPVVPSSIRPSNIELHPIDHEMLAGKHGPATGVALELVLSFAALQGATQLLDVSRCHIDSCVYTGPASLAFPEKLLALGGRVAVPTTMNSISIDSRRWRELGMDQQQSRQAERLANAFVAMGAQSTFTCAPYSLSDPPLAGDQLGWGESNAVVFANSILGARTQKYPDLLDTCIALTGRAPLAGCHTDEGRRPTIRLRVPYLTQPDDATYAALGYLVGHASVSCIPLVYGLEHLQPSMADLKSFCAAFGTTSSAPMLHVVGITPEASQFADVAHTIPEQNIDLLSLHACFDSLNTAKDSSVGLVSLGNPHFLLEEFQTFAALCKNHKRHPATDVIITTSQATYTDATLAGYTAAIEAFGASVITDTCWCMISEPVIKPEVRNIMTNSAKYAHYAPGMCRRGVHFGSLAQCVQAARLGKFVHTRL